MTRQVLAGYPPSHVGLAYGKAAPYAVFNVASGKEAANKEKDVWLDQVANTAIDPDYPRAYRCWRQHHEAQGSLCTEIESISRVLIGHGEPSPTEVGLTIHHTWGVPMLPGSALKGLLAHYMEKTYNLEPPGPWTGPTWRGAHITRGPGAFYRALFGAPAADDDEARRRETADRSLIGPAQGGVCFHDALLVARLDQRAPPDHQPFSRDVLTVHHRGYYNSAGASQPNDYDDPNPVGFLTVKPGELFLLALSGHPEWSKLAQELLLEALEGWGVGGKTSAGYGRFRRYAGGLAR